MANVTSKKGLVLFVLSVIFSLSSLAQNKGKLKEFSKDFSIYLVELDNFMRSTDNDKLKSVYKQFSKDSEYLSDQERVKIIQISNYKINSKISF